MPQSSQNEAFSIFGPEKAHSDVGTLSAIIKNLILRIQTVTLVEIVSCTNSGDLSPVGFVDVHPLVQQITGDNKLVDHGVIYNVPYFRLQGGSDAVIIDPKVGDIGMCGFCSRDISTVKKNKKSSQPGSNRTYDWSDGLYFGGFLNGTPEQYIRFHAEGIEIFSPKNILIKASGDISIQAGGGMKSEAKGAMSLSSSSAMSLSAQESLNAKSTTQVVLESSEPVGLDSPGLSSVGDKDMDFKSKGNINMATEKGVKIEADQNVKVKGSKIELNE